MEAKIIAIFLSLLILGQAGLLRIWAGSWLIPGCLLGLFWFGYTFIPLVVLWNVPISPLAILYIFIGCTLFSVAGYFFQWKKTFRLRALIPVAHDYGTPVMLFFFCTTSCLSIISVLMDLAAQGVTMTAAVTQPLVVAGEITYRRYMFELNPNIFAQIGSSLQYLGVTLGGLLFASRKRSSIQRVFLLGLIFLPAVLSILFRGDKGSLFQALSFFGGGMLICKLRNGIPKILAPRELLKFLPYGLLLIALLTGAFLSRRELGGAELDMEHQLAKLFYSYTAAHLYAFSDWFAYYFWQEGILGYSDDLGQYGFYTFMGIAKLFASYVEIPHGTYEEYFAYGDMIQTNLYTMFRGLIVDYGVVGSYFAMLVMGFFLHLACSLLQRLRFPAFSISLFVSAIGFFYSSFMISLFVWNSPLVSFFAVSAVLLINNIYLKNKFIKNKKAQGVG